MSGKHLCWNYFFENTLFYRTDPVATPESFRFPACNFIIKETTAKMLLCEFCKTFKDIFSFDRTPKDDCFLCLPVNFEFFRTLVLQGNSGKLLFCVQVEEFQPRDTVKTFQAFYTRTRSSHSKAFTHLKFVKTVCEEVNL